MDKDAVIEALEGASGLLRGAALALEKTNDWAMAAMLARRAVANVWGALRDHELFSKGGGWQ